MYGQSAVNYTWDNANRLTQLSQGSATVSLSYDSANRRTSLTLPNGVVAAYGYDTASRLTGVTYTKGGTTVGTLTYGYDAAGHVTSKGGTLASTGLPSALTSATYNANNQLTQWGSTNLSYDLNGSMTSDGTTTYTWDARNRLSAFGSTSFAYDSFGRRIQNAAGTAFLYDGVNAVQELSGGTVTANLLTGLRTDEVFTRTDSAGERDFLIDALGSAIALADSSGTVQTQYSYEAFGNTTASGSSSTNSFQYAGREDDGTGLYFNRGRYYNPIFQRFVSGDPIGMAGGINLYAYAGNNPISFRDPFGTDKKGGCQTICLAVIGIVAIGAIAATAGLLGAAAGAAAAAAGAEGVGAAGIAAAGIEGAGATVAAETAAAGAEGAEAEMVTVTHFTNAEGASAITEGGGVINPGSYVTTPGEVTGMNASEVESALEIDPGKGAFSSTFQTPASNLATPSNGALTSGGAAQFQLVNPTSGGPFVPTPP